MSRSPVDAHVMYDEDIAKRLNGYGFSTLGDALRVAAPSYREHMLSHGPSVSCGIVVNQVPSTRRIRVGKSTGYFLVFIVRGGKFVGCLNADNPSRLGVEWLYGYDVEPMDLR